MKILHVITDLYTGGAERALMNLLSEGLANRFENKVISLREETLFSRQIQELGVPVVSLGMSGGLDIISAFRKLKRETVSFRPEVIQGWMYHGNMAALVAFHLSPIRSELLWNIRQTLYGLEREKRMTQFVIRANLHFSSRPAAIIYNSRLSMRQHEDLGLTSTDSRLIPNGFDTNLYHPSESSRKDVREELGIHEDRIVVGNIARLHPMKNHEGFLRAAVEIAKVSPDVCFLLAGKGVTKSNPLFQKLVSEDLSWRFHLLDERHDVNSLMQAMDIFCLSSLYGEAFPNVLGEAMASQLPCVVTDVGDCADIVGEAGIVVPTGSNEALVAAILQLLSSAPEERSRLGECARERVKAEYSLDAAVSAYSDLYTMLADKRAS